MNKEDATKDGLAVDYEKTVENLVHGLLLQACDSGGEKPQTTGSELVKEVERLKNKLIAAAKSGSKATGMYVSKKQQGKELLNFGLWNYSLEELADVIAGLECLLMIENSKSERKEGADG